MKRVPPRPVADYLADALMSQDGRRRLGSATFDCVQVGATDSGQSQGDEDLAGSEAVGKGKLLHSQGAPRAVEDLGDSMCRQGESVCQGCRDRR